MPPCEDLIERADDSCEMRQIVFMQSAGGLHASWTVHNPTHPKWSGGGGKRKGVYFDTNRTPRERGGVCAIIFGNSIGTFTPLPASSLHLPQPTISSFPAPPPFPFPPNPSLYRGPPPPLATHPAAQERENGTKTVRPPPPPLPIALPHVQERKIGVVEPRGVRTQGQGAKPEQPRARPPLALG